MRFESPDTLDQAVALLAGEPGDVRILAGGTDLLVQLRSGLIEPALVVDLKRIPILHEIREEHGGFRIGAAVCGAVLGEHAGVRAAWPGVVEAVELIGSTQIQGRATLVGNLCNASPAADSVPAMIAAEATVHVLGPGGEREMAVTDVCTGPGKRPSPETRWSHRYSCRHAVRVPVMPIFASSRAPRWILPWSAPVSGLRSTEMACAPPPECRSALSLPGTAGRRSRRGPGRH